MESGITLTHLKGKIKKEDLDVFLSAGLILSASMGSLVFLRDNFEQTFGKKYIYFTISSQPLYLAHWNDLSPEKQKEIEEKRNAKRNRPYGRS